MKDILFNEFKFKHGAKMKNRFVLAPMTTYSSNIDLTLSEEEEVYYNSRAKEFGMVITAATAVSKNAQAFENQISIRDERYLDSMKRLASSIKNEDSKAIIQLHHGGRMNQPGLYVNQDIVSASAVKANRPNLEVPRELRVSEIHDIIDHFANATKLAIKAGFDGIELHGANTYLIQQFFSPHSNIRTDEFGGSLEKRLRFPTLLVERMKAVRKELADDSFIIGYRLSPEELENPGITIEDTLVLVDTLCKLDIDYIHLSLGTFNQSSIRNKSDKTSLISKIEEKVSSRTLLIGSGGIVSKEIALKAHEEGYDLLAVGSASLADEKIITHFKEGTTVKKEIDEQSLLPKNLEERIREWMKKR